MRIPWILEFRMSKKNEYSVKIDCSILFVVESFSNTNKNNSIRVLAIPVSFSSEFIYKILTKRWKCLKDITWPDHMPTVVYRLVLMFCAIRWQHNDYTTHTTVCVCMLWINDNLQNNIYFLYARVWHESLHY